MMDIAVRLARPDEAELAVEWLSTGNKNLFDRNVFSYPSVMTLCAEQVCAEKGLPNAFIPLQTCLCFFIESIGKRPGIQERDMAMSLVKFIDGVRKLSNALGIGESYFLCADPMINEQAALFGLEILMEDATKGWKLLRMKTYIQKERRH